MAGDDCDLPAAATVLARVGVGSAAFRPVSPGTARAFASGAGPALEVAFTLARPAVAVRPAALCTLAMTHLRIRSPAPYHRPSRSRTGPSLPFRGGWELSLCDP